MRSFVQNGNQSPLNPEKLDDFGQLLAQALRASVEQLNGGDMTVKDIFTQVHGRMRSRYIQLRAEGKIHVTAVKATNMQAQKSKQMTRYGTGFWK